MKRSEFLAGMFASTMLAGCSGGGAGKFRPYSGPEVTRILVYKQNRQMYLMHGNRVLKKYRISMGFAPVGHKAVEGDGRTPEGDYLIDRKNPNSSFHLSLGISYPNANDIEHARHLGEDPGGDIFIHGGPPKGSHADPETDWTWGCISVTNRQVEEIFAMVNVGTVISIYP